MEHLASTNEYVCARCEKVYKHRSSLCKHKAKCTGEPPKRGRPKGSPNATGSDVPSTCANELKQLREQVALLTSLLTNQCSCYANKKPAESKNDREISFENQLAPTWLPSHQNNKRLWSSMRSCTRIQKTNRVRHLPAPLQALLQADRRKR